MGLGDIDLSLKPPVPELWLAKSDRTIIAKLNNRSGIGFSRFGHRTKFIKHTQLYKLNSINELEFSIPYQVEINHQLVRNSVVDLITESSLIKSLHNGVEEWFTIADIKKNMDDSKDVLSISCRSLGYELMRRYVRGFKVVSANLSSLCLGGATIDSDGNSITFSGLLQGTLWTLASDTDATFDTIYRSIDISKATVLDALIQVAKTFNAIITWDTINRKISFKQLENIGQDKGGRVTYDNYMRSLENESKTDLLVTRFVPYGKNGLTINSVTTNGQNYIDDFSYFISGFTRDANKNVLTSSPHMSDSLCGALLDYAALQQAHAGDFTTLLNNLANYQSQLTTKNNEMVALQTTMLSIQSQLDIAQTTGQSTSTLLSQQSSQQSLINAKQADVDSVNANITSTESSISSLQSQLSTSNNFTQAQLQELIPFIRESEWTDNNITDPQDLYNQALIQFQKYKTPQIVLKLDMVNVFEDITEQRVWDKFGLGDTILVEYDVLGTSVKSKIVEISFDHAEGNVQLTIASVADLLRQEEQIFNMLYQSVSAANTLSVNVDNWNGIDAVAKNVNAIYNNGIDAAKMAITSAVNNSVTVNNRGITIQDSSNASKFIRATNGVIGFTNDGGNTFSTAIDSSGVYAERLVGQIIAGANLTIANQSGTFSVDGNGVTITGASLTVTGGISDSQISSASTWNNSVQLGSSYNGVVINSANGIQVTNSTKTTQTTLNATNGIAIAKNTGTASSPIWTNQFYTDTNGNIFANTITLATPTITNGTITGSSINVGNGVFTVSNTGAMTATSATISGNITMTGGSISWASVNSDPNTTTALNTANSASSTANSAQTIATNIANGTYSGTFINNKTIYSPTLSGGTIIGMDYQVTDSTGKIRLRIYPNYSTNLPAYVLYDPNGAEAGRFVSNYSSRCDVVGYGNSSLTLSSSGTVINGNTDVTVQTWNGGNFYWGSDIVATRTWVNNNVVAKFG